MPIPSKRFRQMTRMSFFECDGENAALQDMEMICSLLDHYHTERDVEKIVEELRVRCRVFLEQYACLDPFLRPCFSGMSLLLDYLERGVERKGALTRRDREKKKHLRDPGMRRTKSVTFGIQLLHPYCQKEDARLRGEGECILVDGICFSAVFFWLVRRRKGLEFWNWFHTEEAISKLRYVTARQRIASCHLGGNQDFFRIYRDFFRSKGFMASGTVQLYLGSLRDRIVAALERSGFWFCHCRLAFDANNHSLGLQLSGWDGIRLFDPNMGEWHFVDRDAAKRFFDFMFKKMYPDCRGAALAFYRVD